jgi:sugar phosphate isomerase/epimerase
MKQPVTRRFFIQKSILATAGLTLASSIPVQASMKKADMRLGLVTYLWGKDWDLPTLIANCEATGYMGVELRVGHAHGVETSLSASERKEVRKRFADSPITCVGYGSNYDFHHTDPAVLRENIEGAKAYIQLCKDIGATGLKVKPNTLPEEVPAEQTISQIAASLDEIGRFATDLGQLIRVEVHGKKTQQIPVMKAIFEEVEQDNVKICWNCNEQDLLEPGLKKNFHSVKKWFGDTVHIRELNEGDYPYQELMDLFVKIKYDGWILLEARTDPADRIAAMKEQKRIFESMTGS